MGKLSILFPLDLYLGFYKNSKALTADLIIGSTAYAGIHWNIEKGTHFLPP